MLIEHTWARVPVSAPGDAPALGRHVCTEAVRTEAVRGFRLRARPGADRLLSATLFPYGDPYHYAHSCAPRRPWYELRDLDARLAREVGDRVPRLSLPDQLRLLGDARGQICAPAPPPPVPLPAPTSSRR